MIKHCRVRGMEEEAQGDIQRVHYTTLFSFADPEKGNMIDLGDSDVMAFTDNFRLDMADPASQAELLTLLYHSTDLRTGHYDNEATFEGSKTRYFADNVLCYTCGKIGHQERKCPRNQSPFCILCAGEGHYRYNCPQRVCLRCCKCGHTARDCLEKTEWRRYPPCRRCRGAPHSLAECPRPWRVYEFCGRAEGPVRKACPLCLSGKHFLDDCDTGRARGTAFSSVPLPGAEGRRERR